MTYSRELARQAFASARERAKEILDGGEQPPWAWYQYMKLVEATDAILAGMETTLHVVGEEPADDSVQMPF